MSPFGGIGEEALGAAVHPAIAAPAAIPADLIKFLLSKFMNSTPLFALKL
jgi:hypothetical protein